MERDRSRTVLNLQTLYEENLNSVYRVAYTYMHNSFDSEDAAQETSCGWPASAAASRTSGRSRPG